jgi:hypothetical protein
MRRNDHDVTGSVRTTDAAAVSAEVRQVYRALYPGAPEAVLQTAFDHAARLYAGRHPAYHACEVPFHDLQHVLEATLAVARLMDGYERGRRNCAPLPPALFCVGILCALFHDVGYLRRRSDRRHAHGAEYTLSRVRRSAEFLRGYLRRHGLARHAAEAGQLLHYTGHERPVEAIRVDSELMRRIGQMLGTADLMAQMSDRCYLEKRRDRLYPELVAGGLAFRLFRSGADLVRRSHAFYLYATQRLDLQLARAYEFGARHFGGENLYLDAMQRNARHALVLIRADPEEVLRRVPPSAERQLPEPRRK